MKRMKVFGRLLIFCTLLYSCGKQIVMSATTEPADFNQIFTDYWNQMNSNYVYWDIDTTRWDNVYLKYKPLFSRLYLNSNVDLDTSLIYFTQMTKGLIDCHYTLSFTNGPLSGQYIDPALNRKSTSPDFHSAFQYNSIDTNYLDKGYLTGSYATTDNQQLFLISGTLGQSVVYFYCNLFALQQAFQSPDNNSAKAVLTYFLSRVQNPSSNTKGFIIDVRNNSGGDINDLNFFLGQFIEVPLPFGYTRYKSGPDRLSYTPWIPSFIVPQASGKTLSVPLVVLADNFSVSLAEALTMAIKTLPNTTFVGERTWGATGPIAENTLYNDGSFAIPDFLSVTTSSAEFKYINGKIYEGIGFSPDVAVPFDLSALDNGDDPILDSAISILLK